MTIRARLQLGGGLPLHIYRKSAGRTHLWAKIYIFQLSMFTAKERRMFEKLVKSWVKFSICSAVLFFFYHLFINQKLEEEVSTNSKEE